MGYWVYYATVPSGTTLYVNTAGGYLSTPQQPVAVAYSTRVWDSTWWVVFGYEGRQAWVQENRLVGITKEWIDTVKKSLIGEIAFSGIGKQIVVPITRQTAAESVKHSVKFTLGANTHTIDTTATSGGVGWNIVPMEWLSGIPNATTGQMKVELITKRVSNSEVVGTDTKYVTVTVPDSVVPTINSVVLSPVSDIVPSAWNMYLQRLSKVKVQTVAVGAYGSTIKSVEVLYTGQSYYGTSLTTGLISVAGNNTLKVIVTDSRGRKTEQTTSFVVQRYDLPSIKNVRLERCNADGVRNNVGTYSKITATLATTALTGKLVQTSTVRYRESTSQTFSANQAFETGSVVGNGELNSAKSYIFELTLSDGLKTATHTVVLPTTEYTIHFRKGGKGIGLGCAAQNEKELEMNKAWGIGAGLLERLRLALGKRPVNVNGNHALTGKYTQIYNFEDNIWEWLNPPMLENVEYRTTDRHRGLVVYKKLIPLGKLPSNTTWSTTLPIADIFSYRAWWSSLESVRPYATLPSNNPLWNIDFWMHQSTITIKTTRTDASNYYAYIQVEYTKG